METHMTRIFTTSIPCFLIAPLLWAASGNAHAGEGWKNRPYVNLGGGSGLTKILAGDSEEWGLTLGSEAGFRYRQKDGKLMGRTRVAGRRIRSFDGGGSELRLGSFLGVRRFLLGVEVGADVFRNQYAGDGLTLTQSYGVDLPLSIKVGPKLLQGVATVAPAWVSDSERAVDWSQVSHFGLGNEFEWSMGFEVNLPIVGISVRYSERTVASGEIQSVQFGLEL